MEAHINFVKCTIKKCFDTNNNVNLALLQMRSTPIGNGWLSPAIVLFIGLISGLLTKIHKTPMLYEYDDVHCDALKQMQQRLISMLLGNIFSLYL